MSKFELRHPELGLHGVPAGALRHGLGQPGRPFRQAVWNRKAARPETFAAWLNTSGGNPDGLGAILVRDKPLREILCLPKLNPK